jgi:hypothetical protein
VPSVDDVFVREMTGYALHENGSSRLLFMMELRRARSVRSEASGMEVVGPVALVQKQETCLAEPG